MNHTKTVEELQAEADRFWSMLQQIDKDLDDAKEKYIKPIQNERAGVSMRWSALNKAIEREKMRVEIAAEGAAK